MPLGQYNKSVRGRQTATGRPRSSGAPVKKAKVTGGASKKNTTKNSKNTKPNKTTAPPAKNIIFNTAMRERNNAPPRDPNYDSIRTSKPPVCYFAKQGPRDYMEDTYQIMHFQVGNRGGTFYGVFDGHGGKDVSYELVHMSRGLFPYLIEKMKKEGTKNIPALIQKGFLEYDHHLFKKKFDAGSTAVVVLRFGGRLYLVNLGDSRGMIFSNKMKPVVSDDHKPQKPKERRRIYNAGHFVNPFSIYQNKNAKKQFMIGDIFMDYRNNQPYMYLSGWEPITNSQYNQVKDMNQDVDVYRVSNSLALSRAFGDFYLKTDSKKNYMGPEAAVSMIPDIQIVDLAKHKGQIIYIFLASDGFWDVNRNTEGLRKSLMSHPQPQMLCQQLVESSLDKGSQDNTTVVFDRIKI